MNEPINTLSLKDVSLVIATYNEEECIKYVLDELQQFDLGEIIIVDGNSTDNTKDIAETYNVKFVLQSKNGWGSAVKEGIDLTTLPFVTYMDGDGSYNPKALIEMRNLMNSNDAVFCSRYKDGAKSPDDTPIRAFGNKDEDRFRIHQQYFGSAAFPILAKYSYNAFEYGARFQHHAGDYFNVKLKAMNCDYEKIKNINFNASSTSSPYHRMSN